MWFIPLSGGADEAWLVALLARLLVNDRPTIKLLGANPFPSAPPQWVRASVYHYRFSTPAERRESGAWWIRTWTSELVAPFRGEPA